MESQWREISLPTHETLVTFIAAKKNWLTGFWQTNLIPMADVASVVPALRARLAAYGFDAPVTPESVGLVESLLDAFLLVSDKAKGLAATAQSQASALFTAEKTGPPLRREIARLVRENAALHAELIAQAERAATATQAEDVAATSLRGQARDLTFLCSSLRARVNSLEAENAGLREAASRSFEANGIVLPSGHEVRWHGRKERMEAHSPVAPVPPPIRGAVAHGAPMSASAYAVSDASSDARRLVPAAEPARLVKAAESQLSAMLLRVQAVEGRASALEDKLTESRAQVASREAAVARLAEQLAAALEEGPPAEARRVEQQAHAAAIGQLDSQVNFLSTRCMQLEEALRVELHRSRAAQADAANHDQALRALREHLDDRSQLAVELQRAAGLTQALSHAAGMAGA